MLFQWMALHCLRMECVQTAKLMQKKKWFQSGSEFSQFTAAFSAFQHDPTGHLDITLGLFTLGTIVQVSVSIFY